MGERTRELQSKGDTSALEYARPPSLLSESGTSYVSTKTSKRPEQEGSLQEWRADVLQRMLLITVILGSIGAISSSYNHLLAGEILVPVTLLGAISFIVFVFLIRRLGHTIRSAIFLGAMYLAGTSFYVSNGIMSGGRAWLFAFVLTAGMILGLRAGLIAFALSLATISAVGWASFAGLLEYSPHYAEVSAHLPNWITQTMGFIVLSTTFLMSLTYLFDRLSSSATSTQDSLTKLKEEVSDRERAQSTLRASEERYRLLAEHSSDIIWELDHTGVCTFVSPALEVVYGWRDKDLINRQLPTALGSGVKTEGLIREFARLYQGEIDEVRVIEMIPTRTGPPILSEIRAIAIRGEDHRAQRILGLLRDVSDRKELEEQLLQSQKMEAVGQLAGGIAHDFNNILLVINGYSDMVLSTLDADDPNKKKIEEIGNAGRRAEAITRQLLGFSRYRHHAPEIIKINEAVLAIDKMLSYVLGDGIDFELNLEPDLVYSEVDRGHVEQIALNLAINARDAMPDGGSLKVQTRTVTIGENDKRHPGIASGTYAELSVADTGRGMDRETLAKIFEPFFTTKDEGKGTGLGLTTIKGIVKQNDGYIEVDSEPGIGTEFRVYLPGVATVGTAQQMARSPSSASGGSETILIAEDDSLVRSMMEIALTNLGYHLIVARDGLEALELAQAYFGNIDMLLTDIIMPKMNGVDLAQALTSVRPGLKTLFVSGYADDGLTGRNRLKEGDSFLPKPFTVQALGQAVRTLLEQSA